MFGKSIERAEVLSSGEDAIAVDSAVPVKFKLNINISGFSKDNNDVTA